MISAFLRQTAVGGVAAVFVVLFWISRPEWSWDMRLWKAFGDAALMLLFTTLVIGALARLWSPSAKLLPWRKYAGIWFGLMAAIHGFLVWDGWARWDISRFFGYEFVPELGRIVRLEPGFGLANLIGGVALSLTLILMATSTERALKYLGTSWKWLHYSINTIFYLSAVHTGYFLYIHYTLSFHKNVPPPDWFRVPFLLLVTMVLLLQSSAFVKTVKNRRNR
jgi:sulfoxide reductase heme-binding subunit YedZ